MQRPAIRTAPWLLALLAAPIGLVGCSPTATYGTGEAPELAMLRELGGGILTGKKKGKQIAYGPRAPLVMPPQAEELPPPADPAAVATADWPVDPNQRVAALRSDDPRYAGSQKQYRDLQPLYEALPKIEIDKKTTGSPYDIVNSRRQQAEFKKALAESKGLTNTERRYLTDPPETYREPAATAPAEFEDIEGGGGFGFLGWFFRGR